MGGIRGAAAVMGARTGARVPIAAKLSSDDPAQLFPAEAPQYPALEQGVSRTWREVRRVFALLRVRWLEIAELEDTRGVKRALTTAQQAALDVALEKFLREMAGADRSPNGFASPNAEDGLVQQHLFLSHQVGVARAHQLVPGAPNPAFTAAQRQRLSAEAFQRLSEGSRLRFETRLVSIKDEMLEGFRRGDSPLSIARELGRDLDGYEQGRLRTIVRTEAATASEAAILDTGAAGGVRLWDVVGDPTTDELCVNAQNDSPYTTAEIRGLLPLHPNCFDTAVPHEERD